MAQAALILTTAPIARAIPASEVIDLATGEVLTGAEAARRALLRHAWARHADDGAAL